MGESIDRPPVPDSPHEAPKPQAPDKSHVDRPAEPAFVKDYPSGDRGNDKDPYKALSSADDGAALLCSGQTYPGPGDSGAAKEPKAKEPKAEEPKKDKPNATTPSKELKPKTSTHPDTTAKTDGDKPATDSNTEAADDTPTADAAAPALGNAAVEGAQADKGTVEQDDSAGGDTESSGATGSKEGGEETPPASAGNSLVPVSKDSPAEVATTDKPDEKALARNETDTTRGDEPAGNEVAVPDPNSGKAVDTTEGNDDVAAKPTNEVDTTNADKGTVEKPDQSAATPDANDPPDGDKPSTTDTAANNPDTSPQGSAEKTETGNQSTSAPDNSSPGSGTTDAPPTEALEGDVPDKPKESSADAAGNPGASAGGGGSPSATAPLPPGPQNNPHEHGTADSADWRERPRAANSSYRDDSRRGDNLPPYSRSQAHRETGNPYAGEDNDVPPRRRTKVTNFGRVWQGDHPPKWAPGEEPVRDDPETLAASFHKGFHKPRTYAERVELYLAHEHYMNTYVRQPGGKRLASVVGSLLLGAPGIPGVVMFRRVGRGKNGILPGPNNTLRVKAKIRGVTRYIPVNTSDEHLARMIARAKAAQAEMFGEE